MSAPEPFDRAREGLTELVIGAAIEVHRHLGPGLLESAYETCLAHELRLAGMRVARQVEIPITYKGIRLEPGYRMDLVVHDGVVVEVKAVERLLPVHEAQLLTYLRLSGHAVGLLINFQVAQLRDGIRRFMGRSAGSPPLRPRAESPPPASRRADRSAPSPRSAAATARSSPPSRE
jgi:GxxExxY protein